VRTYCKFVHPGTELVHNGYTGGWWGSEKEGDDSAFGSVDMGFINTEGTWDPNVMERGIRWTISGAQPLVHGQDH
jgi:hypothetical protein